MKAGSTKTMRLTRRASDTGSLLFGPGCGRFGTYVCQMWTKLILGVATYAKADEVYSITIKRVK